MPLVGLDEIRSLFVCPRCRSPLVDDDISLRCSCLECELSKEDSFPLVGGCPALVDFDKSVVNRAELQAGRRPRESRLSVSALPKPVRIVWKPPNRVAAANVRRLLSLLHESSPLVLVVGGGTIGNGVEALYVEPGVRLIGFDIGPSSATQFIADAHQIPLPDGTVDAVVVQAVLEHVLDPGAVVAEIHRVLRHGGLVYAETPFLQQVHAGPYDFVRFTSSGHRYLFRSFEEIAAGPVAGPGTQLLWSVDHLVRGVLRSELAGKAARALFIWLRYLDGLVSPHFAMDSASAYYFLGRRSDRHLQPGEIISYYRGAQQA